MTLFIGVTICFASFVIGTVQAENCNKLGTALYESMGCLPKYGDGGCPVEYICNLPKDNETCFLQGEFLKEGEKVYAADAPCNGECTCKIKQGQPSFQCGHSGCPGEDAPLEKGCYKTYEPGNCCKTGVKCRGKDEINICNVGGVEFEEGRGMRPNDTCTYCHCTKDGPKCSYDACLAWAQLYHQDSIKAACAPLYMDGNQHDGLLCCPNTFVCPDGSEEIHRKEGQTSSDTYCQFGNHKIHIGDYINSTFDFYGVISWKIRCECLVPPLAACYQVGDQKSIEEN